MMFICGGAFEGLYDQVYLRVVNPGSGEKLKSQAIQTADGQVRIETRFALADFLKPEDLFEYGMVPAVHVAVRQRGAAAELDVPVLKEILLDSLDSPFNRSRRYFEVMKIRLEIDDMAAAMIAEEAEKNTRTGARALRTVFGRIINRPRVRPMAARRARGPRGRRPPIGGDRQHGPPRDHHPQRRLTENWRPEFAAPSDSGIDFEKRGRGKGRTAFRRGCIATAGSATLFQRVMMKPWTLRVDLDLRSSLGQRTFPNAVIVQQDRNLVMGPQAILDLDAEDDLDAAYSGGPGATTASSGRSAGAARPEQRPAVDVSGGGARLRARPVEPAG